MPRKAVPKAAPAAPPLSGYNIATSGRFSGTSQTAVQSRLTALGASTALSVTSDTTHLIATEKDYESNSTKVNAAATHGVPVVTLGWLDACQSSGSKVDESQYLLSSAAPAAAQPSQQSQQQAKGKKRAASSPSPTPVQDKKPKIKENAKVGDGQNAKSKQIAIQVDEYCPRASWRVYVAHDGTIYDASLNQTNSSANNNKFYKIQLLTDGNMYTTWTRWGRVGERGQNAELGDGTLDDAINNFEKKFKDKSGLKWADRGEQPKAKKYAYVERSYNPDSEDDADDDDGDAAAGAEEEGKSALKPAKCTLDQPTQDLMKLIFNQTYFDATMTALNYDANKLPLGKLSKGTIARGFQALKDLSELIDQPGASEAEIQHLSNVYLSVIPHNFGRNRPPVIQTNDALKKEIELLESLSDMKETAAMLKSQLKDDSGVHQLDKQFQGLGMNEMTPLDHKSREFVEIDDYLNKSKGDTHSVNYAVQDIFRIERKGEFERFDKSKFSKIASNRRLLWHGSRVTNFGGILGQGLRIAPPEAPVSGYMFGKGIYLADMSSKSANYCASYNSGNTALLLLCEAELGNPMHQLTDASYSAGEDAHKNGMYSTWGMGMTGPRKWKDAGCLNPTLAGCMMPDVSMPPGPTMIPNAYLMYNEYIAYDVAQVKLRYLLRVQM
ncbi:poly polymerase 2 ADP-ribosyltransferase 2 [Pyrenophora tritici-repentis]|uniref:Poly [ADP-ribose] polymerase n=1 Tax=Pyrenophora tritici-repentis TaxID=45151 RepID=A0A2W1ETT6_9PLEO|nr:poly polymerase 2 ADP-ribosyltransferase 2 [Pyrenophora tritici-repentis]KAF7450471.1 poly polymerase 2 ADP-ribosyltransferase 2 [Pyrenophora tritici-repentis]KAF7573084.1 poly polymerase 2 ADP-ribosyltransferase 2 [Pyrenophora tritici-repentis]KAG9381307.1 poly polymerase 2 ADP-ribosyltransferase 2 [Pyrenophora tritici-repentis]KAI0574727.1 poly polymerase 2 ADP-ribosyltransferase 2 [Pyrenophora tritici-repentis]